MEGGASSSCITRWKDALVREYTPYDHVPFLLIPFKNRWSRLAIYAWTSAWTTLVYQGWQPLQVILYHYGAYAWLCEPSYSFAEEGVACPAQSQAVQALYIASLMSCALLSIPAGILFDKKGPLFTGFLGMVVYAVGWIMLVLSSQSVPLYIPAFILIAGACNIIGFPTLVVRDFFPSKAGLAISFIVGSQSLASAVPILLDSISKKLDVSFAKLIGYYLLFIVVPTGIAFTLSLPLRRQDAAFARRMSVLSCTRHASTATYLPGKSFSMLMPSAVEEPSPPRPPHQAHPSPSTNSTAHPILQASIPEGSSSVLTSRSTKPPAEGDGLEETRSFDEAKVLTQGEEPPPATPLPAVFLSPPSDDNSVDIIPLGTKKFDMESLRIQPSETTELVPIEFSFGTATARTMSLAILGASDNALDDDGNKPRTIDWRLLSMEVRTWEFALFVSYYLLVQMQLAYFPTTVNERFGSKISTFLGYLTPTQAIWGTAWGVLVDFTGTLFICALLSIGTAGIYGFGLIDSAQHLQYFTCLLYVVCNSYVYTTRYTFINETFSLRNFGTLVGIVGASSALSYPINLPLQVEKFYVGTYIAYLALCSVALLLVALLYLRQRSGIHHRDLRQNRELSAKPPNNVKSLSRRHLPYAVSGSEASQKL